MKKRVSALILVLGAAIMLSACAGVAKYNDVFTTSDANAPNVRTFDAAPEQLYMASCRVLLADDFRIEKEDEGKSVVAARYWTEGKKMIQLAIEINVLPSGEGKTTAYASAVQSVNETDVNGNYLHIPIFIGLSLPTPIKTGSTITNAQEEEKTVKDAAFYRRLFKAIGRQLSDMAEVKTTKDAAANAATLPNGTIQNTPAPAQPAGH